MAKIEVEHRGLLTSKEYAKINQFFDKNGQFLDSKKRFSVIYVGSFGSVSKDRDNKIDLKVRVTNKVAELVLKHGNWSARDARKEYSFEFDSKKFSDMIEFLKILGQHQIVVMATETQLYKYQGIEFAIVKIPDWGCYFEAEILTDKNYKKTADLKIEKYVKNWG